MNDQAQMMNQSQMMNMNPTPMMSQAQMLSMNQPPPQMLNQQQQQKQPQLLNQSQAQQMMMSRGGGGYGMWPPVPVQDQLNFNQNPMNFPGFVSSMPLGRNNWKGKKGTNDNKRLDMRRKGKPSIASGSGSTIGIGAGGSGGGYKPPTLKELQHENRLKARKYFQKKKFDKFSNRSGSYAPRNTSSFIIRAKKSGGIASLVSPCPVTPAVLPTPMFSPSREVLGDMAKEEWGVDGYGSMNGLIRLRSLGNEADAPEDEEEEEGGSSESDLEEHLEVERRLDHDLSRFEMIYPSYGVEYNNVLENRVDDQDTHIAQVEEENLILKERLFLMERELSDLRRRLLSLERQHQMVDINEEVVENESENDNGSRGSGGYSRSLEENEEVVQENNEGGDPYVEAKEENNNGDVIVKHVNFVEAKETYNNGVVEVKDTNNAEAKVDKDNGDAEVKGGNFLEGNNGDEIKKTNNVEAMELNDDGDVEVKETNNFKTLNDAVVRDVCMEELVHKQDEMIAGTATFVGAQNECSEGQ